MGGEDDVLTNMSSDGALPLASRRDARAVAQEKDHPFSTHGSVPGMSGGARWYAVAAKPGQELTAARHLERQGFEVFTPSIVKTVRHARRRMERRVALFPGYLFVRFDIGQCAWRSVNGTLGVRYLVMAGDRPLAAPRGLVESFIELSDNEGLMQSAFEQGQRVEILSGPFASWVGTVERMDDRGRVFVLLRLMNGEGAVAMDPAALWPAA